MPISDILDFMFPKPKRPKVKAGSRDWVHKTHGRLTIISPIWMTLFPGVDKVIGYEAREFSKFDDGFTLIIGMAEWRNMVVYSPERDG